MEQFDNFLIPSELENFNKYYERQFTTYMRVEITEYLLQSKHLDKDYYDFGQFFDRLNITDHTVQKNILNVIFKELKDLGWKLATIFGDTGLLIVPDSDMLKNSVWAASFDFTIL